MATQKIWAKPQISFSGPKVHIFTKNQKTLNLLSITHIILKRSWKYHNNWKKNCGRYEPKRLTTPKSEISSNSAFRPVDGTVWSKKKNFTNKPYQDKYLEASYAIKKGGGSATHFQLWLFDWHLAT